ncbi:MAG: metal-dependent hydrolase [Acidobacteriales bacterium]|nr:metal-dependent hydrolase [Terriglobales bacterium]
MSPVTHFLAGWLVASADGFNRRERAAVALAGVVPDLDGIGIIPELLTRHSAHPLDWFSEYHHLLGHNLAFGLLLAGASLLLATKKLKTALFVLASFHLHLLCDLVGSRGPEGEQWPIIYLAPFSQAWQFAWSGQWALNAWPNFAITTILLFAAFYLAWQRGYSPLEMVSRKADAGFVALLRRRFPLKALGRHA